MLDKKLDIAIRKLCCSDTRDVKYEDIKWIMTRLGFSEKMGSKHRKFLRSNYPPLIVAYHKPFRPFYLKKMCDFLQEQDLWDPNESYQSRGK